MIRNLKEARELQAIIRAKNDRLEAITREIRKIQHRYKNMTDQQLAEAVRDVTGMRREKEELRNYITKAEAEVMEFFAPQFHTA